MACRREVSKAMSDPVDPVGAYLALLARDRDARLRQAAAVRLAELRAETARWVVQLAALGTGNGNTAKFYVDGTDEASA